MLTDASLKTLIADNLSDDRLFGIQLLLTEMITRKKYDAVTPQYRMQIDGVDIISLADLTTKLATQSINKDTTAAYFSAASLCAVPTVVSFPNIKVTVDSRFATDNKISALNGTGVFKLAFVMVYANDGDTTLPLKILNVVLL